jgi:hypothetical protein
MNLQLPASENTHYITVGLSTNKTTSFIIISRNGCSAGGTVNDNVDREKTFHKSIYRGSLPLLWTSAPCVLDCIFPYTVVWIQCGKLATLRIISFHFIKKDFPLDLCAILKRSNTASLWVCPLLWPLLLTFSSCNTFLHTIRWLWYDRSAYRVLISSPAWLLSH